MELKEAIVKAWEQPIAKKIIDYWKQGNDRDKKRVEEQFETITSYLLLDMEVARDVLDGLYKYNGSGQKPKDSIMMLRSVLVNWLFAKQGFTAWAQTLACDAFYSILSGLEEKETIAVGTFYLFMNRIIDAGTEVGADGISPSEQIAPRRATTYEKREQPEVSEAETESNKSISEKLVKQLDAQRDAPLAQNMQYVLASLLALIAVAASYRLGLIPENVTVCGDGSSIRTQASPYGTKKSEESGNVEGQRDRQYSDPDAQWGWDATKKLFFFGHRMYQFVSPDGKHNLPLAVGIGAGNESDYTLSLNVFEVLRKTLRKTVSELSISKVVLDAGHDSIAHHQFFLDRAVQPFIDIRQSAQTVHIGDTDVVINDKGTPVCQAGAAMRLHTIFKNRQTLAYSCCAKKATHCKGKALYTFRPELCPQHCNCSPDSSIGPFVYILSKTNPRLFPLTPRESEEYANTMKLRTSVERSNSVKKETYSIEYRYRTQAYFLINLTWISILEHAQAWRQEIKELGVDIELLKKLILNEEVSLTISV